VGWFREFPLITTGFLFSKLQICSEANFFCNFALLSRRVTAVGCYIDFSGFSTSWVNLAQECFLNTTDVTAITAAHPKTPRRAAASLAGAFKRRKTSRDCIHGADI
jgi:hypothetical protein